MVARFDLDSVSLAQKPKSAKSVVSDLLCNIGRELTDFDVAHAI